MKSFSDLTVIIPTLNESADLPKLIGILLKDYRGVRIIVADDGSTDGTKEAVARIGRRNKNVRLLDRTNKSLHGLTASVVDAAILATTGKIVVMDGDMQHPPDKVAGLAKALDHNDIAVGVRKSVKDWGLHRRIISKLAGSFVYAAFVVRGKPTISDMMTGFFGIRTDIFKHLIKANRQEFVGSGYKVLLDILRTANKNTRIKEMQYGTFHDRMHGKSKLGTHQLLNVLRSALR